MLGVLGFILDGIELVGQFVVYGVETVINSFTAMLAAAWALVVAVLPSMPSLPSWTGHPQWLDWLNWFYPVGDLVAGLAVIVAMWVSFLAVRYVLRFLRQV